MGTSIPRVQILKWYSISTYVVLQYGGDSWFLYLSAGGVGTYLHGGKM